MKKIPLICRIRLKFITPSRMVLGIMRGCGLGVWKQRKKCFNCPYYHYDIKKFIKLTEEEKAG